MMTPVITKLIDYIKNLSNTAVDKLLAIALEMVNIETITIECCPYCGSSHVVHNGRKRGISNEYVCINTGVQRDGAAMAGSVNRTKPDAAELQQVYRSHIEDGTLLLCYGLKSYDGLKNIADCTVRNINTADKTENKGLRPLVI